MATSSGSYNAPCAACKFLRRKCMPGCIFAPYFPPEEPQKFANVHKIFGASNVTKLLNELLPHQREDAVNSLAYEAEARVRDPVYGCVGAISFLQRQVDRLQKELDAANADLIRYANEIIIHPSPSPSPAPAPHGGINMMMINQRRMSSAAAGGGGGGGTGSGAGGGNFLHQTPNNNNSVMNFSYPYPYPYPYPYSSLPWNDNNPSGDIHGGGGGNI